MKYENEYPIVCDDYVIDDNFIYFSFIRENALLRADRITGEVNAICCFPHQDVLAGRLYKACLEVENRIFFSPTNATELAVYNIKTGILKMIPYKMKYASRKMWSNNTHHFWTLVSYKRYIYFLGHSYPGIIKMDIFTEKLEYIDEWVEQVELLTDEDCNEVYLSEGAVLHAKGYFPILCADAILELDLESGATIVHSLKSGICGFNGIAVDKDYLWLTPRYSNDLLRLNINDFSFKRINISDFGCKDTVAPFQAPVVLENKIVLLPILEERALFISKDDFEVSEIKSLKNIFSAEKDVKYAYLEDRTFAVKKINNDELSFINSANGIWYKLNSNDEIEQLGRMILDEDDTYEQFKIMRLFNCAVNNSYAESKEVLLCDFVRLIKCYDENIIKDDKRTCGQDIYNNIL